VADFVEFKIVGAERFVLDLYAWRDGRKAAAQRAADAAAARVVAGVRGAYARGRTGNLIRGVRVDTRSAMEGDRVWALARTGAPHSHLYEWGTKGRHNARGAYRGAMPRRVTFVPIAIRERERFNAELRAILAAPVPAIGPGNPDVQETGA